MIFDSKILNPHPGLPPLVDWNEAIDRASQFQESNTTYVPFMDILVPGDIFAALSEIFLKRVNQATTKEIFDFVAGVVFCVTLQHMFDRDQVSISDEGMVQLIDQES